MSGSIDIGELRSDELEDAIALLTRAFWNDPLYTWLYRSEQQRHHFLNHHFRSYMSGAVPLRTLVVRDATTGALLSLASFIPQPGVQWDSQMWDNYIEEHRSLCDTIPFADGDAIHHRLVEVDKHWSSGPLDQTYWYLLVLVTDPAHAGHGYASALVARGKQLAKAAGCGVSLEACNERVGVPYYQRLGFEIDEYYTAPHFENQPLKQACPCESDSACPHRECATCLAPVCVYMTIEPERLQADESVLPL
jgi:GNAT superfamily N-acetyltransferase